MNGIRTRIRVTGICMAAVFILASIAGCGGDPSQDDVLNQLKPDNNETYALHLFYENILPDSETTELNKFHNSDQRLTTAITKVQFWDQEQERNVKWASAIGIKDFPMYVLLDRKGIVLETPYLSRIEEFLAESLLKE
ncbi:hypothetical protein [Paenibacillus glycanilyticus]|uniref:Uncharacterized protein n=1 Tax=Paenibacillus glycanilyticus TaxID=126569 RepID=A0ABQ6G757_9BACL|nr:hypothetical protein [Paenibacillus glycanilyticus]GLX66796.1 hypothetical protein MU1_11400 [Paenibacillus glycanilyticus]